MAESGGKRVQLPPFNKSLLLEWFDTIEHHFREWQIVDDMIKYQMLIAALDPDTRQKIDDMKQSGFGHIISTYKEMKHIIIYRGYEPGYFLNVLGALVKAQQSDRSKCMADWSRNHPFDESHPSEWFKKIEKYFMERHIFNDLIKYKMLIASLDSNMERRIHSLIRYNCNCTSLYKQTRSILIYRVHSPCSCINIWKILSGKK